jgi:ATP-dependent DNA ligase
MRGRPYCKRRRKLEELLARALPDGWALAPATTDPAVARTWMLTHTGTGLEGVVAKRLEQPYRPGQRGWQKLRSRITAEAVVGGITGPVAGPHELILGRHDDNGRLRIAGRTTALRSPTAARLGALLEEQAHAWPEHLPAHTAGAYPEPLTPASAQPSSSRCPPTSLPMDSDGATPCGSSAHGTNCRRATSRRVCCRRRPRSDG